jgi:hypothetical protein
MSKYYVTVQAVVTNAVVEETYLIDATDVDTAEQRVIDGEGELINEDIIDFGTTVKESVVEVKSK